MIDAPILLQSHHVIAIHRDLVQHFGGAEGVRDPNGIASALGRAQNLINYADSPTIFKIAAALAGGLAQNHPFVDGNKRVAFDVAVTTLAINGWTLDVAEHAALAQMLALTTKAITEDQFAQWLAANCYD